MKRKINVGKDLTETKTVFIHDIIFKGKRSIDWNKVEAYLKQYVGKVYKIEDYDDMIFIGSDFPDEYTHSNYTKILRGANAKAKANVVQGIPKLIEYATNKNFKENRKEKHNKDAKYGWYSYDVRVALPVFSENGKIERYNIFNVALIVRHAQNGKMYLYDIVKIKKETSNLFQSKDLTQ